MGRIRKGIENLRNRRLHSDQTGAAVEKIIMLVVFALALVVGAGALATKVNAKLEDTGLQVEQLGGAGE